MSRVSTIAAAIVLVWPTASSANDLAETLNYVSDVMGEHVVDGYEDFMDWDETEALGILVASDVEPNRPPGEYDWVWERRETTEKRDPYFATLGPSRLDYQMLEGYIIDAAAETGLPAALIDAVIRTESGYRPNAVSRAGAQGLMQLMPATAASVGVTDSFDPRQNILGGARYLKKMFDRFGRIELAVAAYNAGPTAVKRHGGIPPFKETLRYVKTVIRRYEQSPIRVR